MASLNLCRLIIHSAAAACVLIHPCPVDANPEPASSPNAVCTVLMGGGGTVTPSKDINSRWFAINSTLSRNVLSALSRLGYHVQGFIVDIQSTDQRAKALQQELYKTGCSKVLQITDELGSSAAQPGVLSKFTFVVSVSRLEAVSPPSKAYSRAVRIVEEYEVAYEYDPNAKVAQDLSELAQSMATDVDKAGVLAK